MANISTAEKADIQVLDETLLKKIGNTPIVRIRNLAKKFKDVEIYAKLEWYNAGGSIKARPALRMIEDGEKSGRLTKDKVILDSTSGNTGIAYALIGLVKGYKVKLAIPADVCKQTEGRITHFIAGIGTGGTVMGTGRGLKRFNPNTKIFAVEPAEALHGIEGLKHMETSIKPGIYDESFLDGKISVKTEDAYKMVSLLQEEEGLGVGHSSGAAMRGALELAERIGKGVIVTVFPDSCECYVTTGDFQKYKYSKPSK